MDLERSMGDKKKDGRKDVLMEEATWFHYS